MPVIPQYFQQEMPAISRSDQAPLASSSPTTTAPLPIRRHRFPTPKLRLHLNQLSHEGSSIFLSNTKGNEDLETQVQNVLNLLYAPDDHRPGTRSVTFVLRSMDGVAYTDGTDLDTDHKEIHFNLNYITGIQGDARHEMLGVICHELVHCFQYNARGTCPGGLIEGIADWVRLRAGLAAKHWRQEADGKWDGGYQHTGFFLDYLEGRFGEGTVRKINGWLRGRKYDEKTLFADCCSGHAVGDLWEDYKQVLKSQDEGQSTGHEDAPPPVPTHAA